MSEATSTDTLLQTLRDAGAAQRNAVRWHYIEVLAERTRAQTGPAQALLNEKLGQALRDFEACTFMPPEVQDPPPATEPSARPSPLALLLREIVPPADTAPSGTAAWSGESPRVRQFRKQLRKISVHKQVSQAIAQAPQNAGPINSHMLVVRALGLMRDISPDYLNRFMAYADTLLCLDETDKARTLPKKTSKAGKTVKPH